MDIQAWDCCRMCLSRNTLFPIFPKPEYSGKYSDIIQEVAGIKVEINDGLPQNMCNICINFINESCKFRRRCEESNKILLEKNVKLIDVTRKTPLLKEECKTETHFIYIPDLPSDDDDFKDYDDNITLDTFKLKKSTEDIINNQTEATDTQNKKPSDTPNNKKRKRSAENEQPKRKVRKAKENREEKEKEKPKRVKEEIECEYCHKILTSKLSLRNHYKIHTGFNVVCEHCGKKFITKRLLLMHCKAKHGYEKTDKCSYCDYKASNAEQVKIHERLHTGERPYVCSQCGAGFHRNSSYLQHIATHLPEKTVQCELCPRRFQSGTLMRIHLSRHRPPRYTFRCGACAHSFTRRRNVARHLAHIHGLPPAPYIHRTPIHTR